MFLNHIQLTNYRNHAAVSLHFSHRVTAFTGLNGSGKTNLLDAIGYLATLRSFLSHADHHHVRHGTDFFAIRGVFERQGMQYEVACQFRAGQGKTVTENGIPYQRLSAHVGKYPMVLIAPQDMELISGSSEIRRKFFDQVISQTNPAYLHDLLTYQHTLQQRNSLLSRFYETRTWDEDLLETYDEKLVDAGTRIASCRQNFMQTFAAALAEAYTQLGREEQASVQYQSRLLENSFPMLLRANRQQDRHLMRTTVGPHRDDFIFFMNGSEIKRTGSQGQQKSFVAALKLAQYQYMLGQTGVAPMLLMDDLFDKLDDLRVSRLLTIIANQGSGQVFITDAHLERTLQVLTAAHLDFEIMPVGKTHHTHP